jgi:LuxR family transcriptional regulator, maltose regulon positive regulatory protein
MTYTFGEFTLDTRRCELGRAGEPRHLEPQVYAVLCYLLENRDRLVTRHELLDHVWGHRFVSPATLSSRIKALRQVLDDDGHAQRVIRTVRGRGFRFVAEVDTSPAEAASARRLDRGRAALSHGRWDEARQAFEQALALEETAPALEGLSWTAFWLGDAESVFELRQRAYARYQNDEDRASAARMAIWLGCDHIDFRGEDAIAQGWYARAARLLEGLELSREHGWLAFHTGAYAMELHDDTDTGKRQGAEAARIGRALGVVDLEMVGLALEGLALVTEGRVEDGMRCLDEAAVAALGGEVREHVARTWSLCYLIYACERARDFDRAAQWCKRMEELSTRIVYHLGMGACRAHYAHVLILRGEWEPAEAELARAATDLERSNRLPATAESDVRLGELRRRQGRIAEAADLFERTRPHPVAVLGSAAIALEQGEAEHAADTLEQLLLTVPPASSTQRADALALFTRVRLALGDLEGAAEAAAALEPIAASIGTRPLLGAAAAARGQVAGARQDHSAARSHLETAIDHFERCGLPYEASRTRLDLAACLEALGRPGEAARQADMAKARLRELGAMAPREAVGPLSPREMEVLRQVAEGLSDPEIGRRLHISPHTVHRHVSNIHAKLGVSSRAAAAAQAVKLGLA